MAWHVFLHLGGGGIAGLVFGLVVSQGLYSHVDQTLVFVCGVVGGVIGLIEQQSNPSG